MRHAASLSAVLFLFSSCDEKKELTVTETRPLTTRDQSPKLFATSDERFRDTKPSPVRGVTPDGWLTLPATPMRLLNYRFGESGLGEVWVSISSGTVLDNVNRWLRQFDVPPVDAAGLAAMRTVSIAGTTGVWVEATGEYASGMGAAPKSGQALAGVVADLGGRILTVKMVGPQAEVEAARATLEKYIGSLKMAD
jgi:hypothetical protein